VAVLPLAKLLALLAQQVVLILRLSHELLYVGLGPLADLEQTVPLQPDSLSQLLVLRLELQHSLLDSSPLFNAGCGESALHSNIAGCVSGAVPKVWKARESATRAAAF
jgi:hypothetical protein